MDPHLLDAFAARSVGTSLADFTRAQRTPAPGRARQPRPARRARRWTTAVTGAALVTLPSVAVIAQTLR